MTHHIVICYEDELLDVLDKIIKEIDKNESKN
jgi:hypothetical protein